MASFDIVVGKKTLTVKGDSKQWTIGENVVQSKTEDKGVKFNPVGHYSSTAGMMNGLAEMKLRQSDAEDIMGIQIELKKIRDEIMGLYSPNM
jgi:uncharacterized protein YqfB (UPF0267 family)